ncbi:hypothetical protein BGX24_008157 [Mortierella sp. AD032]|nr:hypothetical protein BGX24_008157 [Mortierella sp. AD032]
MQSFILVGGVDTTAAPTVVYDIDPDVFSDTDSASRCQSPNLGPSAHSTLAITIPSITTTNLSSPSPSTSTSFSQAMKSRFGRERSPTSPSTPTAVLSHSSSFRRSRSRNPSAPAETLATGTGGGGLLAATAASMRKKLNRRSLSVDSLPSSPRQTKTQQQPQAQKLANAGGRGRVTTTSGGDISIGMSVQFSGSTVGGMLFRLPNGNSNTSGGGNAVGGTVAFQDARKEALARSCPQQGGRCNNNGNTGGGGRGRGRGRKNENVLRGSKVDSVSGAIAATSTTSLVDNNINRDGNDDCEYQDPDAGNSTLSSDVSWTLDATDLSFEQKQQKTQLYQNSMQVLSMEHSRSKPRGELKESTPPSSLSPSPSTLSLSLSKTLRRKSDPTLISAAVVETPNSSRIALDTSLALEDLEKEIDALKTKEVLLSAAHISISTATATATVEDDIRRTKDLKRGLHSPRREAKIMLVSSSALPTQFYDSIKTRNVLRTYLTSSGLEFDEMIEYGFPSEAFMNNDDEDDLGPLDLDLVGDDSLHSQHKKVAAELAPSCRFLTLRITLTPWHARANESTLYGPRVTAGRQLQFKAMVNRFFSRSNITTNAMIAAPLSSPSSLSLIGTTPSPKLRPVISAPMIGTSSPTYNTIAEDLQRSVHPLTSVTLSALDAAPASGAATPLSRPSSRATGRYESRSNSRASSPGRERSSPSSRRGSPATDLSGSNTTPLLSSYTLPPTNSSSRMAAVAAAGEAVPRVGRRLFSPTPFSTPSLIPVPISNASTSQPPRKGSLSALSLPINLQHQQATSSSSPAHAPMVPPRRKGSTPALFFTPPSSTQSLESTTTTPDRRGLRTAGGREIYPSPSSRAAQNYGQFGFSPPPRRPSDQSDTISASLATARGLNALGNGQENQYFDSTSSGGKQREKAGSFDTESQPKKTPRYPHYIHIKQPATAFAISSSSHIPRRQGSHDLLATLDTAPWSPTPGPILPAQQQEQQQLQRYSVSTNGSEEQIYECYHVAGLDNIYNNASSRVNPPAPSVEKKYHPHQTVPQSQQQQQQSARQGIKLFPASGARGKGDEETRSLMASLAAAVGVSAEQTPMSAAPPRIQAKNQRRRGGASGGHGGSTRNGGAVSTTDRDHVRRQCMLRPLTNTTNANLGREEEEMDECEMHVGDISFEAAVDGLDDGVDQDGAEAEAAKIGGCWRPIWN